MPRKLKITEMRRLSPEEFRSAEKTPLFLVLDNVRSLHNVGSLFRTADALRLRGLCLCGITGTPPHPELRKTALGAEEVVEWEYFRETAQAVQKLKAGGAFVLALEQALGSVDIREIETLDLRGQFGDAVDSGAVKVPERIKLDQVPVRPDPKLFVQKQCPAVAHAFEKLDGGGEEVGIFDERHGRDGRGYPAGSKSSAISWASLRSVGVVILMFSRRPSTMVGATPQSSLTMLASSVRAGSGHSA